MTTTDTFLRDTLRSTRVIAVVGFSPDPSRPSHYVAEFLRAQGYRVIPVNPGQAGKSFLGETVAARLADIPAEIEVDMVDIFRNAEAVPGVVEEAMAALPHLRTIWMQLGIAHEGAAEKARAAGLAVVEDRCPKMEIPRLFGRASPLEGAPEV
ncbi:CoA-binding protein [Frigidibacter mobilis]|uniref:CoA-binding domain-containing protein n=1 Tax=Frigidibacter mobilis TaxID=1335048 RepID=A0A159Z4I5_9RHOB|nr:CoA-binding protein [Frigidibacter mobilis]AMY70091.1 CoA-binding domain-containing protein [Frigidibacter mobilis]